MDLKLGGSRQGFFWIGWDCKVMAQQRQGGEEGGQRLELESRIFESLFQRRMLKAPFSLFCIVHAAADVLDG